MARWEKLWESFADHGSTNEVGGPKSSVQLDEIQRHIIISALDYLVDEGRDSRLLSLAADLADEYGMTEGDVQQAIDSILRLVK